MGTVGRGEQIRDEVEQASREGLVDGAQAFRGNIYDSRLKDAMIALAQLWNRVPLLGCDLGKIQLPQRPLDALVYLFEHGLRHGFVGLLEEPLPVGVMKHHTAVRKSCLTEKKGSNHLTDDDGRLWLCQFNQEPASMLA